MERYAIICYEALKENKDEYSDICESGHQGAPTTRSFSSPRNSEDGFLQRCSTPANEHMSIQAQTHGTNIDALERIMQES